MREHVRLGRIAGVNVGINWSVLAIFLLITFGLAAGRFPQRFPDLEPIAYTSAGLASGIVFLLSLLAHELSHAVVAQRNGVGIEGITLWLFGGVARMEKEAPDPGAELRIAGVGPLVSLLLSGVFLLVAAGLRALGAAGLVWDVFVWLGVINLALAVFNLVPAAPLDGGRILRSLLWRWRGDRTRASITASRAGRAFGWVLVVLGFVQLVTTGFGGIWLMLIGWFLTTAASAEERYATASAALSEVRAGDVMSRDPTTVPENTAVDVFVDQYVFPNRYSTFPVTDDDGETVGLVTLKRVKQVPVDRRGTTVVGELACALDDIPIVGPDDLLSELLPRMQGCSDGRALVMDDGQLVGIVSPTDVMRRLEIGQLGRLKAEHNI